MEIIEHFKLADFQKAYTDLIGKKSTILEYDEKISFRIFDSIGQYTLQYHFLKLAK